METSNTKLKGSLKISEEVIATIARLASDEIDGIESIGMPPQTSIRKLFLRPNRINPIKIDLIGEVAEVSLNVVIKYGHKITTVAENVQSAVKEAVQSMTGIPVSKVNVNISGVSFKATEKE